MRRVPLSSTALVVLLVLLLLLAAQAAPHQGKRRRLPRRQRRQHTRARGRRRRRPGKCSPVLLSEKCRKPADRPWCLQPMQSFTYEDVKRAGDQDVGLATEFGYSTAKFANLMSQRDGPLRSTALHHYILHKANRYAVHVLERTGKFKGKLEYLLDRDLSELEGFDWSKCAVVGNSGRLLKRAHGKEIDGHTAVIRFNEAPTSGFEKFVGSKTTVRLQNPERIGFSEGEELCLSKHFSKLSRSECKVVPLSPQFIAYSRYYWLWSPKPGYTPSLGKHREKRVKMSTGFLGIALAAHLCDKITVYGFEAGAGDNHHYYNKTNTRGLPTWKMRHPWPVEKQCIDLLGKNPSVRVVK